VGLAIDRVGLYRRRHLKLEQDLMATIRLSRFLGLRPRSPESLLGEGEATVANNCDFAYGELRSTKSGFLYSNMSSWVASIYTDDGTGFYTWPTDVNAVRSPLVNDIFHRMYYTDGSGLKVADRRGVSVNGGQPPSPYTVGVPRPTVAPTFEILGLREINNENAIISFKFHYESGGTKYQEQDISPTGTTAGAYEFLPPALIPSVEEYGFEGTPDSAVPVIRLSATWRDTGDEAIDIYSSNSSLNTLNSVYSLEISNNAESGTYTVTLTAAIGEKDKEVRAYVYTYVNTYNEEGPPSPPGSVTTSPVMSVQVTVTEDSISGYAPIKEIRVYRTPTGSTIASYFYVGSVSVLSAPPGPITFTDDVRPELLNEEISSLNNYPPDPALTGVTSLPNGILCAWKGNELHFCEAYRPWAWPPAYVKTVPHNIVGIMPHGSGAVMTTLANPYMLSGVAPDSMTLERLNIDQAGVSKWSMASVGGAVVYASNDGIVTVYGGGGTLAASETFFTRESWRTRTGGASASMRFAVWDGRLIVYSPTGAFSAFMIRLDEASGTMTDLPAFGANCTFTSVISDQLYFAVGAALYQFNGGTALTATWQSREVTIERPVNFGMAQALVEGAWTIELWAYDPTGFVLKHSQSVTTGRTNFRLPAGYKADRYRVKINGTGRFRELRLAQTGAEMAAV
jgi:hypothetical protein